MKRKLLSLTAALLCAIGSWADTDYTSKVNNAQAGWTGASGIYGNAKAADQTQLNIVEKYWGDNVSGAGVSIFSQTVSELPNGTYMVVFYATANNARCPEDKGGIQSDASDLVYVYAGSDKAHKTYVTSRKVDSYTYPDEYVVSGAVVTDGTLELGMYAEKTGTQWQTIQVKALIRIDEAADDNGVDLTKAIINPSIYNTTQTEAPYGWTFYERTAGNENRTAGTGNTCLELWNNNDMKVDVYQQISNLSKGAYKVTANCHDQNGTGKYSVYGYNPANSERATGTINVSGDGAENYADITTDYLLVTDGRINIGLIGSSSASWITGDDFRLKYYGNAVKVYSPTSFTSGSSATADTWYEFTVAPAGWYRINSSADATLYYTQNNSDDADATASKALTAGTNTIINLTAGSFFFKSSDASTIKIEAANGVLQDGDDVTNAFITNPSFETGNTTGWEYETSTDHGAKENSNGTYTMSNVDGDYLFNIWESGNTISQTLKDLPAGIYKLTAVMGTDAGATFRLMMGGNTGNDSSVNKGTGVTVTVYTTLAADGDLTISADAGGSQWYKVDNFILTYYELATDADYTALSAAITSAEARTLGFEDGEYAPYNNIAILKKLDDAKSIIAESPRSSHFRTDIQALKSDLESDDSWTTNDGEVNAIYNPTFALSTNDKTALGWSSNDGTVIGNESGQYHSRALVGNDNLAALNETKSALYLRYDGTNSNVSTIYNYGTATGYTMPLKGNTVYRVKADAGVWSTDAQQASKGLCVAVINSSSVEVGGQTKTTPSTSMGGGSTDKVSYDFKFKTGESGNYTLTVDNMAETSTGIVISNFELFKSATVNINEDDNDPPVAGLANVTLTRTIKANKWNTFCVPFDMSSDEITGKLGAGAEVKKLTGASKNGDNYTLTFGDASSIEAGKPYMVKVPSEVTSISLTGKTISRTLTPTTEDGVTFTGVFTSGYAPLNSFIISNNAFYFVDTDSDNDGTSEVALKAFRGYITVGAAGVKALSFVFDDNADGIKAMDNGRWTMNDEEAPIYNLAGQRIQKMQKGINIVNGKKIMK